MPAPVEEALTVRFEGKPGSRSGTPFSFRVVFNQAVEIDEAGFAAHALVVGNGTVTAAARVEARRGAWSVTIEPDSVAAVSVSLANPPCGEPGAVCTALGGRLEVAPAEMVPGPAPGVVTGFDLVDTTLNGKLATLSDGSTVELADPSADRYGIVAQAAPGGGVKSVTLSLSGSNKSVSPRVESVEPWSLYGDDLQDPYGEDLPVGSYTLSATAHSEIKGAGAVLGTLSVRFTVQGPPALSVADRGGERIRGEHRVRGDARPGGAGDGGVRDQGRERASRP